MLSKSDIPLPNLIKLLTSFNTEAGYLVPTETGMSKSILDAHGALRSYLAQNGVHDFDLQGKGTDAKVTEEINVITASSSPKDKPPQPAKKSATYNFLCFMLSILQFSI